MNSINEKKQIHIFSPGKNIGETYKVAVKQYSISSIIVFTNKENNTDKNNRNERIDEINNALKNLQDRANEIGIDFQKVAVSEDNINDVMENVFKLRDEFPQAQFYFNLTGGGKVLALNLFTSAIWVGGLPYYVDKNDRIIEFSIPRISPAELQKNRNLLKILEIVNDSRERSEKYVKFTEVYDKLAVYYRSHNNIDNDGRYKLPRGTFSKWVRKLIDDGLLYEEYIKDNHKSKCLNITKDGEFALIFSRNR